MSPSPTHQVTLIPVDEQVLEQLVEVRLKATGTAQAAETGIWLVQGERGRGTGLLAMAVVLEKAMSLGFSEVKAETTADNHGALGLLNHLGFALEQADDEGRIKATKALPKADATGASPS